MVEKLEGLSSTYFRSHIRNISRPPVDKTDNRQLFLNIEIIDEAISRGRKIKFNYLEYNTDKKLHIKQRPDGTARQYVMNPYHMAIRDGKYYLICNHDRYDDIANYRIDRIQNISILDEPVKPFEKLKFVTGRSLDIISYMREHPYMFSSGNIHVKLRAEKSMISDIIDRFGENAEFSACDENHVIVSTYANELALEQFAKSFAPYIIVLEPASLVKKYGKTLRPPWRRWKEEMKGSLKPFSY